MKNVAKSIPGRSFSNLIPFLCNLINTQSQIDLTAATTRIQDQILILAIHINAVAITSIRSKRIPICDSNQMGQRLCFAGHPHNSESRNWPLSLLMSKAISDLQGEFGQQKWSRNWKLQPHHRHMKSIKGTFLIGNKIQFMTAAILLKISILRTLTHQNCTWRDQKEEQKK